MLNLYSQAFKSLSVLQILNLKIAKNYLVTSSGLQELKQSNQVGAQFNNRPFFWSQPFSIRDR